MPEKIKAFVSYAPQDRKLKEIFVRYLTPLTRQESVELYDDIISAGIERQPVINTHLDNCQLIILLISPDFVASDNCYCQEMKRAVERHDSGEVRVIPIILRTTDVSGAPFSKLQALPSDGKPVTKWRNRDDAFFNVIQGIRQAIKEL